MNIKDIFSNWTKNEIATNIFMLIGVIITASIFLFVSDYDASKEEVMRQANSKSNAMNMEYIESHMNAELRVDEQLKMSSTSTTLTKDLEFRESFQQLQNDLTSIIGGKEFASEAVIPPTVMKVAEEEGITSSHTVFAFLDKDNISSGTVYYIGHTTKKFTFRYEQDVIQSLELVKEYETQQVDIAEE